MSRDSNGNASVNRTPAVSGQTVLAEQVNVPFADIQSMLNLVFWRDGLSPMTGNLNLNGFKITNSGEPTLGSDPVTLDYFNSILAQSGAVTGEVKAFRRTTAPTGWVKENGGTIGNASSGATTRANADTLNLFRLLWEEFSNTVLPIQTSAGVASIRGASAAADFAANKRMPLFDSRTRFLRGADDGLGFDATLTVGLSQADSIKNHKHPFTTDPGGAHTPTIPRGGTGGGTAAQHGPPDGQQLSANPVLAHTHTGTTNDNTDGSSLETRGRSSVVLYCIKL
jgi:hypothetical protein